MLNTIFLFLLLGNANSEYDATARYNDSLLIYNTYHSQIETLKKLKETDLQKWYDLDAANDRIITCAKLRLKKYNHQSYEPVMVFERKGMGMAYAYPKPHSTEHSTADAFAKVSTLKYHYVVYDKQTRFCCDKLGSLHIPYILKYVYDQGRLLFMEKLNPVTMERIAGL